jgi:hypothetical protein
MILDFVTRITFREQQKLWRWTLRGFLQSSVIYTPPKPKHVSVRAILEHRQSVYFF